VRETGLDNTGNAYEIDFAADIKGQTSEYYYIFIYLSYLMERMSLEIIYEI